MPKKTATRTKKTIRWKTAAPSAPIQGELFNADTPTIEVTLRVPSGTPITIGKQNGGTQEVSLSEALRKVANASKEELRAAITGAKLQSQQLIGLCTVIHGNLYHLAAIGSKVANKPRPK